MPRVTVGPLPEDGTRLNISQVLDSFVSGTTFDQFDVDDFAAAQITFLSTQTDAPATSVRGRGTLWFARGEGVLYKWELFPSPTNSSNATEGCWIAMSNRREVLVKKVRHNEAGDVLTMRHDADEFKYEMALDGRHTLVVNATNPTDILHLLDPVFISNDSSQTYAPAVEWGFCSSKVTGNGLFAFLTRSTDNATYQLECTNSSGWTNINARCAIVSQSDSSSDPRTITVFKCPQLTNWVR